jgi:transposase
MKKFLFIGIDFSKSKFDAYLLKSMSDEEVVSGSFENNRGGYVLFLKWVSEHTMIKKEDWVFCGEHTGLYSRDLAAFLSKKKFNCLVGESLSNQMFMWNKTRKNGQNRCFGNSSLCLSFSRQMYTLPACR